MRYIRGMKHTAVSYSLVIIFFLHFTHTSAAPSDVSGAAGDNMCYTDCPHIHLYAHTAKHI